MKTINQIHSIRLTDIDIEDRTYTLNPCEEHPGDTLLASINKFGILHSPILLAHKDTYIIITGRKRITAAIQSSPNEEITCHVLPPETDHKTICSFLLEATLSGRPLTVVEQINFFELFLQTSSSNDALPLLEKLGHKPQKHVLNSLLSLRSLENEALLALHNGIVPLKSGYQLLTFSTSDQKVLVRLITKLRLGGSKQRKLIELSKELLKRKDLPLEQIFTESPVPELEKVQDNIPQHATALLAWLQKKCFPKKTRAEDNFKQQVTSLNLPSNMDVKHTPSFEDDKMTLSIEFPNMNNLTQAVSEIKTILQEENILRD